MNLSIRHKLLILLLVPAICLCGFIGLRLQRNLRTVQEMNAVTELSDLAVRISVLLHSTQKERGMTAGFLASKGTKFQTELPAQRRETDQNLADLQKFLTRFDAESHGPKFTTTLNTATGNLNQLSKMRQAVSSRSISTGDAIGYYTRTNAALLEFIHGMTDATAQAAIAAQINAYVQFLEGKERAGIERAVMSSTFAQDQFGPGMYAKFLGLVTEQTVFMAEFQRWASADAIKFYLEHSRQPPFAEVEGFRSRANLKAVAGGFGIDAGVCFAGYTKKINLLKKIDDFLAEELVAAAASRKAAAVQSATWSLFIGSVILILILIGGYAAVRSIVKPINGLIIKIKEIAEGDGDLTQRIANERNDELGALVNQFNKFVEMVHGIVKAVDQSVNEVAGAATEIAASSEQMARSMDIQQKEIEQITSAMAEMGGAVREVAGQSANASKGATDAGLKAEEGGQIVAESVQSIESLTVTVTESAASVEQLGHKSEEIGEIVSVINDIADQTNLLALNAAIEAARAGEHGRGFAVVADEVRVLADRTTNATGEIARSIQEIQNETAEAVRRMNTGASEVKASAVSARRAGETLGAIVESSRGVAQMVTAIAAATEEQSASSEQINRSIATVSAVVREASEGTKESACAATNLSDKAEGLRALIQRFKL